MRASERVRGREWAREAQHFRACKENRWAGRDHKDKLQASKDKGNLYGHGFLRNSTTFFFSNFTAEQGYEDLWRSFQKWGKVVDVYIAPRRDKKGERFGFVRFVNVDDVKALAKNLDSIWLGEIKLKVNIPRFNRYDRKNITVKENQKGMQMNNKDKSQQVVHEGKRDEEMEAYETKKNVWSRVGGRIDNVWSRLGVHNTKEEHEENEVNKLVVDNIVEKRNGQYQQRGGWTTRPKYRRNMRQYIEEEYKVQGGLEYKPKMDDKEWISKSWVGTLHGYEEVEDIQNIFCAAGFYQVKTVKMGGKEILLSPIDDTDLEQLFSKEVDWIDTHFESIKKCSPSTVARERVTWVKCIGVPLMALGGKHIATTSKQTVDRMLEVAIEGERYCIKVVEEMFVNDLSITKLQNCWEKSVDSDSEVDSSVAASVNRWAVEFQKELFAEEEDDDVATWVNGTISNFSINTNNDGEKKDKLFNEVTNSQGVMIVKGGGEVEKTKQMMIRNEKNREH
ncbi:hypothetical protein RIF29_22070 [Crotalaria pallida]|uniref:RRM domain-containing protein n=1 Tax=Crotalaria pallida TaxID=3830 RepID=A0AAN9F6G4_CROPI